MLSDTVQEYLDNQGAGFATIDDCAKAMLLIATDTIINGKLKGISRAYKRILHVCTPEHC